MVYPAAFKKAKKKAVSRKTTAKKKSTVKRKRTPAQIAATKRLVALNKKKKTAKRKANPVVRKKATRTARYHVLVIVPSAAGIKEGLNPKTKGYWTGIGWDTLKSKAVKYSSLQAAKNEAFHLPAKYRSGKYYAYATELA